MHAIVVIESAGDEGVVCRILDSTLMPPLSSPIELRIEDDGLKQDAAFLGGRPAMALPGPGNFAALAGVEIRLADDTSPVLVARSVAEPIAVAQAREELLTWGAVEDLVAEAVARSQPDDGILYVVGPGAAYVVASRGAFLFGTGRHDLRTAQECALDGARLPAEPGFHYFAGEPWSYVDREHPETEHAWGMRVEAFVPATDAHLALFGVPSRSVLHQSVLAMLPDPAPAGPSTSF